MGLFDKVTAGIDDRAERMKAILPFSEKLPGLCELWLGSIDASGTVNRKPGSVRIFCNGGRIKVEVNGQDWPRRGFFAVPEGELSIEFIERTLQSDVIEWVPVRDKKLTSTDIAF